MTTDLWSNNVVHRSYHDLSFVWVDNSDEGIWSLKTAMYACKVFEVKKTAENLWQCMDGMLTEVGYDPDDIPVTTDKGDNIVAATSQRQQLTCICHSLNTAQEKAWDNATSTQVCRIIL